MRIIRLVLVLLLTLNISCAAVLVGGLLYKSSKTREAKQQFMAELNRNNLEREKAGLPPLDICTEKYYFDKKWADNDPECAARIIRYESGDKTALGTQVLIIEEKEVKDVQE